MVDCTDVSSVEDFLAMDELVKLKKCEDVQELVSIAREHNVVLKSYEAEECILEMRGIELNLEESGYVMTSSYCKCHTNRICSGDATCGGGRTYRPKRKHHKLSGK